ncbi:larval cuticle protein LCP-22 [Episyrphus balteatus]|uniref:larval cuticle protein LCP-22 n=1 Tax=Episyrphus balteatus TaxID=286459 RepID=UPI002485ECFF|nr:larval cuticle protein LCP-22 [Episyrphus balteatus]
MFKLCVAIVVFGCLATLIEGQARPSYYQQQQYNQLRQPYYQQNRYQPGYLQGGRFGQQQRPGYYNPNSYNKNYLNNYYNRPSAAFVPLGAISNEGLAKTVVEQNDIRPDGSYEYVYETENGIRGEERNIPKSLKSGETSSNTEGSYGYTSPEGLRVLVNYVADEEGFRPVLSYSGNGAEQFINSPEPSSVIINKKP